jgi:germacradienol/geosmin synthase
LFRHASDVEIPALCDSMDLPSETRKALERYVGELEDWMSGILSWHQGTRRYQESELLRRKAVGGVGGLGGLGALRAAGSASAVGWRPPPRRAVAELPEVAGVHKVSTPSDFDG